MGEIKDANSFDLFLEQYKEGTIDRSLCTVAGMLGGIELMISTKEHKRQAVINARKVMGVEGPIVRLPIRHIDEPNHIKQSPDLLRGKTEESIKQFQKDYPVFVDMLDWFKQLDVTCLIQDVRPKAGVAGQTLNPLTNPTSDVVEHKDIRNYIANGFDHGQVPTVVRIENLFERVVVYGSNRSLSAWYPYAQAISRIYINYLKNPLSNLGQVDDYLYMSQLLRKNTANEKNYVAAGGLLNEVLVAYALLSGIPIEAKIPSGISERTKDEYSVLDLLKSVYPQSIIHLIGDYMGVDDTEQKHETKWEKVRDFATIAIAARDFAVGGSHDAVGAVYKQQRSKQSIDPKAAIYLKPNMTVSV